MAGQYFCVEKLKSIAPIKTIYGWQKNGNGTSQMPLAEELRFRKYLGLTKIQDKKAQTPESHALDGIALAATEFIRFGIIPRINKDIYTWKGSVNITRSVFRVITRPAYFRRALHFDNAEKGGIRKRIRRDNYSFLRSLWRSSNCRKSWKNLHWMGWGFY